MTTGSAEPPENADRFSERFERSFSLVAYITNRHLVDHFMRARRSLGVDFEQIVLWAVVAHQNVAHLMPPGSLPGDVLNDLGRLKDFDATSIRPVRLRHLSEITGVPRETARRKLAGLKEAGWLRQVPEGWVVNHEQVGPDLREFTQETVRRLLATAREVERVLKHAGEQPGPGT